MVWGLLGTGPVELPRAYDQTSYHLEKDHKLETKPTGFRPIS
jgi:hypothetical protein